MKKLILAILLLIPCRMFAQTPSYPVFSGTITNSLGEAVPNATVIVLNGTIIGAQAVNSTTQPGAPLATICATQTTSGAIVAADPYCNTTVNQTTLPLKTDGSGNIAFAAASGWYVIQSYGPGIYGQQLVQISLGGSGGSGGGLTQVGYLQDGVVFGGVLHSPVTVGNQPGPLTPTLQIVPAGYVLAGPRPAVPGKANVVQNAVPLYFHNPSNVTSFAITMPNPTTAGNTIILESECIGRDVNNAVSFTVTDQGGDTFVQTGANGPDLQIAAFNIAGGAATLTASFTYGGGGGCPDMNVGATEVTNLTGTIDLAGGSGAGRLILSPGVFAASMTTAQPDDFIMLQTTVDNVIFNQIDVGPPVFTQDQSISTTGAGSSIFADSFTTVPGLYSNSITSPGQDASSLMVPYVTGGTFNAEAPWVARLLTPGDLPAGTVQSPFTVLNNQDNIYSTGLQNLQAATGFYAPVVNSGCASHNGEILYIGSPNQYSGYFGGGCAWFASYPNNFNPTNNDLALLHNSGGVLQIQDSAISFASSIFTVPGKIVSDATGFCIVSSCITAWPTGGGGSGVTNFSTSGSGLAPLFSTTVTNPTTTPDLTFALTAQAAHTVFGNFTGGSGSPGFTAAPTFSAANLTNFPTFNQSTSGNAATASASDHSITPCATGPQQFVTGISTAWVLTCGVPSLSFPNQSANTFFAGPTSGGATTPAFRAIVAADVPTLNQNTTGTASNLSGTPTLPNGTAATTQTAGDSSTKVATTAFVQAVVGTPVPSVTTIFPSAITVAANTCANNAGVAGSTTAVSMMGATTSNALGALAVGNTASATGWGSVGGLVPRPFATSNQANWQVCNQTSLPITTNASITFVIFAK